MAGLGIILPFQTKKAAAPSQLPAPSKDEDLDGGPPNPNDEWDYFVGNSTSISLSLPNSLPRWRLGVAYQKAGEFCQHDQITNLLSVFNI
jgi:hypothetical protein